MCAADDDNGDRGNNYSFISVHVPNSLSMLQREPTLVSLSVPGPLVLDPVYTKLHKMLKPSCTLV